MCGFEKTAGERTVKIYYTYLWLREDGTPYYAGKGSGDRAFAWHKRIGNSPPRNRILIQPYPSEADAFVAEVFLVSFYGRKDLNTGCLSNMSGGGENPPKTKKGRRVLWGAKISKTLVGNPICAENGRLTGAKLKGRPKTGSALDHLKRIQQIANTPENIRKRIETRMRNGGFSPSVETRRKISETLKMRAALKRIA